VTTLFYPPFSHLNYKSGYEGPYPLDHKIFSRYEASRFASLI
jgi:hypothetical protein